MLLRKLVTSSLITCVGVIACGGLAFGDPVTSVSPTIDFSCPPAITEFIDVNNGTPGLTKDLSRFVQGDYVQTTNFNINVPIKPASSFYCNYSENVPSNKCQFTLKVGTPGNRPALTFIQQSPTDSLFCALWYRDPEGVYHSRTAGPPQNNFTAGWMCSHFDVSGEPDECTSQIHACFIKRSADVSCNDFNVGNANPDSGDGAVGGSGGANGNSGGSTTDGGTTGAMTTGGGVTSSSSTTGGMTTGMMTTGGVTSSSSTSGEMTTGAMTTGAMTTGW